MKPGNVSAIKREVIIGDCRLLLGDCREILPLIFDVDAIVTSPPYDNLRDYGIDFESHDWRCVISIFPQVLVNGGVAVWNVNDGTIDGSESGSSFRQALHAIDIGLKLHDTMIYCKEGFHFVASNRYAQAIEYMFVFSKGKPKTFNGICDWKNKSVGTLYHGKKRLKNGQTVQISKTGKIVPEFSMRRNWWIMHNAYNGSTLGHPAPMPFSMARDQIYSWTNSNEFVCDPFMGSGTTGVACVKLNRKFVGIELDENYFNLACSRIREAYAQPNLFHIENREFSNQVNAP